MALRNVFERKRYTENRRDEETDRPVSYRSDKEKSRLYYGREQDRDYNRYYDEEMDRDDERDYRRHDYTRDEYAQRPQSIYGGDTRNYGNPNQSGFDRHWWEATRRKVRRLFGLDAKQDRRHAGAFTGRGPKNYHRIPGRIYEDVCDRLMEDDYLDASDIEVIVENDVVILKGTVRSKADKRRAEDIAASVRCVRDVENRLRVAQREISVP